MARVFVGSPGVSKSAVVRQAADALKLKLVDVRATLLDPVDLRGLPKITKDRADWCPPAFLPRSGSGVLFLDELAQAPPLLLADMTYIPTAEGFLYLSIVEDLFSRRVVGWSMSAELVWTGPEAPGVANRNTSVVVREMFGSATSEVIVAGFAVYQGQEVFRRLDERMAEVPGLRVRFFLDIQREYRDETAASELVWKFLNRFRSIEWPGEKRPELYYDPRSLAESQDKRSSLHAKCIDIDSGNSHAQ